ncbi:MAG: hypothetical protein Q7Q73_13595 [Verrucomicrobiota bacterium JB024]|nr:hypothetical protein [Verrucomicrobiota bacterium JB024]
MSEPYFTYTTGNPVEPGDLVRVGSERGCIERLFHANTEDARDFACQDTGGILIRFEKMGLQVWLQANEDLVCLGKVDGSTFDESSG